MNRAEPKLATKSAGRKKKKKDPTLDKEAIVQRCRIIYLQEFIPGCFSWKDQKTAFLYSLFPSSRDMLERKKRERKHLLVKDPSIFHSPSHAYALPTPLERAMPLAGNLLLLLVCQMIQFLLSLCLFPSSTLQS